MQEEREETCLVCRVEVGKRGDLSSSVRYTGGEETCVAVQSMQEMRPVK
jgi:hypothetical protein